MTATPLKVALLGVNAVGYQSLALGYLRAFAQADQRLAGRVAFQTLDLDVSVDPWWIAWRLLALEPEVVAVSTMCWNARHVFEVCRILKGARPQIVIVLGGPEVGPISEEVLAKHPEIDVIVRGEGEVTFAELLYALTRERSPWRVDGVTARDDDGRIVAAPERGLISDLDDIPSPYLSGLLVPRDGGAYLETYRGCPHRCAYCFEGKGYSRIRSFSQQRVEAEIAAVAGTPGIHAFSFIDPVFNLTPDRLAWLADAMAPFVASGTRLHTIEVDIERCDPVVAAQLVRAGVASVETGPQTIGPRGLDACNRAFDRERFAAGVLALRAQGISVECDFIVGLPGDDVYDFLAGLGFVLGLDPGVVQTSTLHVLPGTVLWERAAELGLVYDAEPPHELVSTDDVGYMDLRRAEVFGTALQRAYRARIR